MNMTPNPSLETHILDLSRQAQAAPLSDWFATTFRTQIAGGLFAEPDQLRQDMNALIDQLVAYRENSGLKAAVVGMSGGVDSALTAALFREAGWQVLGYTLPIHQNPEETNRGEEACAALGIAHQQVDLTAQYQSMLGALAGADPDLADTDQKAARIRCGNIRARLRMITLYNQAHRHGGLVASTDNFSELTAGFWTINGDVGDLAPVQSLLKSWEVPWMAREIGVPEATWRAKPTDGLGIDAGDEAQIGATYLQWDIVILALLSAQERLGGMTRADMAAALGAGQDPDAQKVIATVLERLTRTRFKRAGTCNLSHPREDRFGRLASLDRIDL